MLRVFPVFSAVFAPLYVVAMYFNIAMFVYYPQVNELHWHDRPELPGPAMYWYGWIAYACLGAVTISGFAALAPASWVARMSPRWSWGAPLASIFFVLYVLRSWFVH